MQVAGFLCGERGYKPAAPNAKARSKPVAIPSSPHPGVYSPSRRICFNKTRGKALSQRLYSQDRPPFVRLSFGVWRSVPSRDPFEEFLHLDLLTKIPDVLEADE